MKTLIFPLIVLLLMEVNLVAGSLSDLDIKNGFRNVKFGNDFSSFKNLKLIEKDQIYKIYLKTNEDLKMGEYQLNKIAYFFHKNKLAIIMIEIKGYSNSRGFLDLLKIAYGDGWQPNQYIETYYWDGSIVHMTYDENSITHNSTIFIKSNELKRIADAEKQSIDQKTSEGL